MSGPRSRIVMVGHAIGSLPAYLAALRKSTDVLGILVKPKSAQPDILRRIARHHRTEILSRAICDSPLAMSDLLDRMTEAQDTILVDIGGYFSNVPKWRAQGYFPNIKGIVEDTENGHQRYERADLADMPVISIARSQTKRLEDWWVGRAIVFSAERQLRQIGDTFHSKRITVLGFGKIGFSIADTLTRQGYDVSVFDTDPCRRVLAKCLNYRIPDREDAIRKADIIFSATGNKALSATDLQQQRRPTFVFSATSGDDEFHIDFKATVRSYGDFWELPMHDAHAMPVFFANLGNAVNFMDGGEIGRYAHMVQSAILHGVDAIQCEEFAPGQISELSEARERLISSAYIDEFQVSDE
ncbi:NAD(P)-binding domain-containing protein [Tabrizicola sp.]|uniref:NAD(P)-binding domain-containing protein n=1 Tax=Tabrizicola sp. TaxID=2005166 RepID=UPI003F2E2052